MAPGNFWLLRKVVRPFLICWMHESQKSIDNTPNEMENTRNTAAWLENAGGEPCGASKTSTWNLYWQTTTPPPTSNSIIKWTKKKFLNLASHFCFATKCECNFQVISHVFAVDFWWPRECQNGNASNGNEFERDQLTTAINSCTKRKKCNHFTTI